MGRVATNKPNYQQLISRNIGVFSKQQQQKIKESRILIVGCGLGSVIAEIAAKTGFGHLVLVDGDSVEASNINRQIFDLSEIGTNKAETTAKHVLRINPFTKVDYFTNYLEPKDCNKFVDDVDIVIDTVDISALSVIISIHEAARKKQKAVLFPVNVGWGSGLLVFNDKSVTLEEMLELDGQKPVEDISLEQFLPNWSRLISRYIKSNYLINLLDKFLEDVKTKGWCPVPQLGIASYLTACLTISAALKLIFGSPLRYAPKMYSLDTYDILS